MVSSGAVDTGAASKSTVRLKAGPEKNNKIYLKTYLLKEYGAWSVLILSYLAGLFSGSSLPRAGAFLPLLALSLLMNSKQAFTRWIRTPSDGLPLAIFSMQVVLASALLIGLFGTALLIPLPFILVPLAYLALLKFYGEHFTGTEIAGFAVLALSALIAKFALSGGLEVRVYAATALFFTAGVFKVKVFFRKKLFERALMVSYVAFAALAYFLMKIPVLILLPLADDLIYALTLYKVKLRTAGWVEAGKGVFFLVLIAFFFTR